MYCERVYCVRTYGAKGDGVSDDTQAIQRALSDAQAGGIVVFGEGVYAVTPAAVGAVILTLLGGPVTIQGQGMGLTTVKVQSGSLPYRSILSAGAMTGLLVEGLTWDHNISANPIANSGELATSPRITIEANGSDTTIQSCKILNASAVNDLVLSGSDIVVKGCRWSNIGDDPNHVAHDASCIYTQSASRVWIQDNSFVSAGTDSATAPGARTAIEIHGSEHHVTGNTVDGFAHGINLAGYAATACVANVLTGNVMRGCGHGIIIFSGPYHEHTSGYGIDVALIEGNTIDLAETGTWTDSGNAVFGIAIDPSAELDVRALKIHRNTITSPLEAEVRTANTASCGIGWYSVAGKMLRASDISGNTIIGHPMAGIRLSCGVDDVSVSSNKLHNCGSTLDSVPVSYKTPVFAYINEGSGLDMMGNKVTDTNPVTRNVYGYSLYGTSRIYAIDNSCDVTGDGAAFLGTMHLGAGANVLLRGVYQNGVDVTPLVIT